MSIKNILLGALLWGACFQSIGAMVSNDQAECDLLDRLCLQVQKGYFIDYAIVQAQQFCNHKELAIRAKAFCLFKHLVRRGKAFEEAVLVINQEPCKDVTRDFMECQFLNLRLSLCAELVRQGQAFELAHIAVQRWLPSEERHPCNFMLETKDAALDIYQALETQGLASEVLVLVVQEVLKDTGHVYYHSRVQKSILDMYIRLASNGIALDRARQAARLGLRMESHKEKSLRLYAGIVYCQYRIDEATTVMQQHLSEGRSHYHVYHLWIALRNQGVTAFDNAMQRTFGTPKKIKEDCL